MRSDFLNTNSLSYKDQVVKHTKIVNMPLTDAEAAGTNTSTWTQPANSILTDCYIVCTDSPTIVSGSIGYDVGTSAAGGEIIAAQADEDLRKDMILTEAGLEITIPETHALYAFTDL